MEAKSAWQRHYKRCDRSKCTCLLCSKNISAAYGNTTNLKSHLKSRHTTEYTKIVAELEEQEKQKAKAAADAPSKPKQIKLDQMLVSEKNWGASNPRKKSADEKLARMIASDYQPFTIVDDNGFRDFIHDLQPQYTIPTRKVLRWRLIPNLYEQVEQSVKSKLECVESLAITTDHWSSRTTEAYIAVTAHFLNNSFECSDICLSAQFTPESHTATNIAKDLVNIVQKWIPDYHKKKIYVIRDNASNIKAACNLLPSNFTSMGCFNHTLQLVLNDSLKEFKGAKNVIAKCKTIVNHFHHSTKSTTKLKEMQKAMKVKEHKLKTFCETRWNSTYHLVERIVEQKDPLSAVLCSVDVSNLSVNEWKTAEGYVQALAPFEDVTTLMSATRYSTYSMIIPVLNSLMDQMKSIDMNDFGKSVIEHIKKRWSNYEQDKLLLVSTALDPRFKFFAFSDSVSEETETTKQSVNLAELDTDSDKSGEKSNVPVPGPSEAAKKHLVNLMFEEYNKNRTSIGETQTVVSSTASTKESQSTSCTAENPVTPSTSAGVSAMDIESSEPAQPGPSTSSEAFFPHEAAKATSSKTKVPKRDFWQRYKQRVAKCTSKTSMKEDVYKVKLGFEMEIERYESEPPLDTSNSPFLWWSQNSSRFPNLALIAKQYLFIPSTSVPSERLFSKSGMIISERRSRLKPDITEQLVFLNQNLKQYSC